MFAFSAFIKPTGNFTFPIYVFTAGGSPYWRQYISGNSSPPSTEYRLDYMFYCSQSSLPGALQYHVQEAGSVPVIRSYVSKTKTIPGWKYKGLSFFAPKQALGGDKTCTYKGVLFFCDTPLWNKVFYWTRTRHASLVVRCNSYATTCARSGRASFKSMDSRWFLTIISFHRH